MKGFKSNLRNNNLLRVAMLSLVLSGGIAGYQQQAHAQTVVSEEVDFNIPSQNLSASLAEFGIQSGVQVSAHGDVVRNLKGNAVKGKMSPQDALNQIISGLGLYFETQSDGSILISSVEVSTGEEALDPIMVSEAAEFDDHAGAADRGDSKYITSTDLARRTPSDSKDLFAGEASISVGGAQTSTQKVYIRGVEEHNLAVTIDGARQNNKNFHHTGNNLLDPSLLKAVRVDPTVAPADAGPGALAGGITYETIDVGDVLDEGENVGGFTTVSFETNGDIFTNSNAAYGRIDGFEILGFVKGAKGDDYDDGSGDTQLASGTDLYSFLGKVAYEAENGHRFEVSGEKVKDHENRPYRANITNLTNRNTDEQRAYNLDRSNYVFNYSFEGASGLFDPKATLGYGVANVDVPDPFGSDGTTTSLSGKIENDFNFDSENKITAGIDFYQDENEYKDSSTAAMTEKADNIGVYAQARISPIEDLRVSVGFRGDRQIFEGHDGTDFTNDGLSGNASLAYDVHETTTLKAGYSNIFGGISIAEGYIYNPAWDYNAAEVKPTRSENFSVGFETNIDGFTFDTSIFRSDFKNARDASYNGGPATNVDFRTDGYEIGFGYNWVSGFTRVSYSDTEIRVDGQFTDTDTSQYLGSPIGRIIAIEAEQNIGQTGVAVGGSIDAALSNSEIGGFSQAESLDGYTVFNLYTEYKPEDYEFLTLRLEANNITDRKYADRATYGSEFTNVEPKNEPGRSFMVYAKAEF
ncbi:TonB-dependent receptor [Curvivirga aplysinae]|uniref:TonB-dependent receptor n=1 Tax=Curvivirga aplysinae TaxID=2529852 RepID=UPI0012BBC1B4|nr:TonB-dependent receptor [Curvivirga aplysinae]MTI08443.1 TonB-dependent receptor [Curvivirga aplysinae]